MDQAVCYLRLTELLGSPDAEMRYGAFKALRLLDDHMAAVQGELLGEARRRQLVVARVRADAQVEVAHGQAPPTLDLARHGRLARPVAADERNREAASGHGLRAPVVAARTAGAGCTPIP